MRLTPPAATALVSACGMLAPCAAQCPLESFEASPIDGAARWLAVFPAGSPNPTTYMSGRFRVPAPGPAQTGLLRRTFSSTAWAPVPGAPAALGAMTQHTDARGAALYIASSARTTSQGQKVQAPPIFRYDGATWEQIDGPVLGSGVDAIEVSSLASFDPEETSAMLVLNLHVSGSLDRIAWEAGRTFVRSGPGWAEIGGSSAFGTLVPFRLGPDSGSPRLMLVGSSSSAYSGGFEETGGVWWLNTASGISWIPLAGLDSPRTAAVYDADGGASPGRPVLAIGGTFTQITTGSHTLPANHIVLFDGATFTQPAQGLSGEVQALAHFTPSASPGDAALLVAAGRFTAAAGAPADGLAAWNGSAWAPFGGGMSGDATLLRAAPGAGSYAPILVWSGRALLNGRAARPLAHYRSGQWTDLFSGPAGPVHALTAYDGAIVAVGRFARCGDHVVNNTAAWTGSAWEPLGSGFAPTQAEPNPQVLALALHDDGSGPALYAGGAFQNAGGVHASNIARWDGAAWSPVGRVGLLNGAVRALESHDPDGPGPAPARLYAAGDFTFADTAAAPHLAWWDGAAWNSVAGSAGILGDIRALKSWDDGSGPALYVGGGQLPGGSARLVWKLTPAGFSPLPPTTNPAPADPPTHINALEVHDDGSGPRLFAAGYFQALFRYKSLTGGAWSPLPTTDWRPLEAFALRSVSLSGTPALILDTDILTPAQLIPLSPRPDGVIRAIGPLVDDGRGPAATLGGEFLRLTLSSPETQSRPPDLLIGAPFLARLPACAVPCYANCDASTVAPVLNVLDLNCFLNRFSAGDPYANCDLSTAPPALNVLDFNCFLNRFTAGCP
jgi:hypothetical protein